MRKSRSPLPRERETTTRCLCTSSGGDDLLQVNESSDVVDEFGHVDLHLGAFEANSNTCPYRIPVSSRMTSDF